MTWFPSSRVVVFSALLLIVNSLVRASNHVHQIRRAPVVRGNPNAPEISSTVWVHRIYTCERPFELRSISPWSGIPPNTEQLLAKKLKVQCGVERFAVDHVATRPESPFRYLQPGFAMYGNGTHWMEGKGILFKEAVLEFVAPLQSTSILPREESCHLETVPLHAQLEWPLLHTRPISSSPITADSGINRIGFSRERNLVEPLVTATVIELDPWFDKMQSYQESACLPERDGGGFSFLQVQVFTHFIKAVLGMVVELVVNEVMAFVGKGVDHTMHSEMTSAVNARVPPQVIVLCKDAMVRNITNQLTDATSARTGRNLQVSLTNMMGKHVEREVLQAIGGIHRKLHEKLTHRISEPLIDQLPMTIGRAAKLRLTDDLTRSLTHSLAASLTVSLGVVHSWHFLIYCYYCHYHGHYCSRCQSSQRSIYYRNYHSTYYADYFADYYAPYYMASAKAMDAFFYDLPVEST